MVRFGMMSTALLGMFSAGCYYIPTAEDLAERGRHRIHTLHWAQEGTVRHIRQQERLQGVLLGKENVLDCLVALRPGTVATDIGDRPCVEFLIWLRVRPRGPGVWPGECLAKLSEELSKTVRAAMRETGMEMGAITEAVIHDDQWFVEGRLAGPHGASQPSRNRPPASNGGAGEE